MDPRQDEPAAHDVERKLRIAAGTTVYARQNTVNVFTADLLIDL